jgi:hypothetical protein
MRAGFPGCGPIPMSGVVDSVLSTVQAEFSDLLEPEQLTRVIVRLSVALLLGAAIGWERERREAERKEDNDHD